MPEGFDAVAMVGSSPNLLMVTDSCRHAPCRFLAYAALCRRHRMCQLRDQLGAYLGKLLEKLAKIKLLHVPKGSGSDRRC